MKKYKIGRYTYEEITEEEFCSLFEEKDRDIVSLIDYDGDPIKHFKLIKHRR